MLQQLVVRADVTGEEQAQGLLAVTLRYFNLDRGGAEHMSGIPEPGPDISGGLDPGFIFNRRKLLNGLQGVFHGVYGADLLAAASPVAPVQPFNLAFLDVAGVRQHHR